MLGIFRARVDVEADVDETIEVEDEEVELYIIELLDGMMQAQFVHCIHVPREVAIGEVDDEVQKGTQCCEDAL